MTELTVILKDSDRTYRQKFLVYASYCAAETDPEIQKCIAEAMKSFEGDPDHIQVKIHLDIQ